MKTLSLVCSGSHGNSCSKRSRCYFVESSADQGGLG
jgi:hypothetical protein